MSADFRYYVLDISEHFFRLTTESLRLHSNATQRHQTLDNLVDVRASDVSGIPHHDASTLKQHLAVIPTHGDIRIELRISPKSAESLEAVACLLGKQLQIKATLGDALSVLLFDYNVEHHAARVMAAGGFEKLSGHDGQTR
jgi:hypothetical protein